MAVRRRVSVAFTRRGTGVHSGAPCVAEVRPADFGTGILFRCEAGDVPATVDAIADGAGATTLAAGPARVTTVEHLLAALWGRGVTDAIVALTGPEVPFLDGSALSWVEGLDDAGLEGGPPVDERVITAPIALTAHGGFARAAPAGDCLLSVAVDFDDPRLPRGQAQTRRADLLRDAGWARTFVLARDLDRLVAEGRGRGATPDNTVVFGVDGPSAVLRGPSEAVRHKLLDLAGDLALLGPVRGSFHVERGSHALHHALLRAVSAAFGPPPPTRG